MTSHPAGPHSSPSDAADPEPVADEEMDGVTDGPGKMAPVMIWDEGAARQVQMRWGLRPTHGTRPVSLLRAETHIVERRCLIVMTELFLRAGTAGARRRRSVQLTEHAPFFCCAGLWAPKLSDWPASFAGLTVAAYPDIAPFQDRHMAIVRQDDWRLWLEGAPQEDVLRPWPQGRLTISGPPAAASGDLLEGL